MRLWQAGLCALALLFLSSAAAAPPDWKRLPYFDSFSSRAFITTDPSWSGAARADLPVQLRASPISYAVFSKIPRSYIWGASCGQGVERRTFTKMFQLPGQPITGAFHFQYLAGRDRPYESATLTVNGQLIAHLGKTANLKLGKGPPAEVNGQLSPTARRAFHYGANTVVIRATKAALPRGVRCRDDKLPRWVGVLADMELLFGGDLRVVPPRAPLTVKKPVTNGQIVTLGNAVQFVNDGPSAAIEGKAQISVGSRSGALIIQATVSASPPFECTADGGTLNCTYRNFLAGQRAAVQFQSGTKAFLPSFENGAVRIETHAFLGTPGGWTDPKGANNSAQAVTVLCVDGATDPACG